MKRSSGCARFAVRSITRQMAAFTASATKRPLAFPWRLTELRAGRLMKRLRAAAIAAISLVWRSSR